MVNVVTNVNAIKRNVVKIMMKKKERLITAVQITGKIFKDIVLKQPRHIIAEEIKLARWHWGKFFNKK